MVEDCTFSIVQGRRKKMELGSCFSFSLAANAFGNNAAGKHLLWKAPSVTRSPGRYMMYPVRPRPTSVTCQAVPREALSSMTLKEKAALTSSELKGTSIFLLGVKNSIISDVGKVLADLMRYYYFDSDVLVEEASGGKFTAKLLGKADEEFHQLETEVLKQLSSMGRLVVCAGSGSVQFAANLALFRHGISVWIDIPLDMVAKDVMEDKVRLNTSELSMSGNYSQVLSQLTIFYEEYRAGFATADSSVSLNRVASELGYEDLNAVTAEDMAMEVLKEIEKLTRVKKMLEAAAKPF